MRGKITHAGPKEKSFIGAIMHFHGGLGTNPAGGSPYHPWLAGRLANCGKGFSAWTIVVVPNLGFREGSSLGTTS